MTNPLLTCAFPASRDTLAGSIMLRLASGAADAAELEAAYTELVGELSPAEFAEFWPASEPVSAQAVPGIVSAVVAEHRRAVPRSNDETIALLSAIVAADAAGLVTVFGEAVDDADAIAYARAVAEDDAAKGRVRRGWIHADAGDLDELILTDRLSLGYGSFDDDVPDEAIAAEAVALLTAQGLPAHHATDSHEVVVDPLVFALQLGS